MGEELKKVVILGTGGTISGKGEAGKTTGYSAGSMPVEDIIASAPGIEKLARLEGEQVCNVASDNITAKNLIHIARRINELAKDPDICGFVITHGTDTMDETAFFLNLTVKTDKPVVITGAMRPATATSADGPLNIYQAVLTAACPQARGKGVMVVFSDRIYGGRDVQKRNTYMVTALDQVEGGLLGVIRDEEIHWYYESTRPHTLKSEFDVSGLEHLPVVRVMYFHIDCDPALPAKLAEGADGLVVASAGAGGVSKEIGKALSELGIPVVTSSRISSGVITQNAADRTKAVAADNLPPQKAAILLRLALTVSTDRDEIIRIFRTY
ncbi:MAG: asparaginase [Firmicutes bacterium]|nr:asparaginase [Bacillota bacterium]MBQ6261373.1 asparaginase [Bacillota bacterium]MBR0114023.1 asparaginase [Bacillota bacterium]